MPTDKKLMVAILVLVGLGGSVFLMSGSGSDAKEKKPKEEEACGCCAPIKTPNGRPGLYCSGLLGVLNGRRIAYQYVSKRCPNGYDFVRENEDAFMVECKGDLAEGF